MPIVAVEKNVDTLTLSFTAEFDATTERVWLLYEDQSQLERWWGPPGWPATFTRHDFTVGGQSRYYWSGPDGEQPTGWWEMTVINAPHLLEFRDGFVGDDGEPIIDGMVTTMSMSLEDIGGRTRVTSAVKFTSAEDYEKMLAMGLAEELTSAAGQIDAILAQ